MISPLKRSFSTRKWFTLNEIEAYALCRISPHQDGRPQISKLSATAAAADTRLPEEHNPKLVRLGITTFKQKKDNRHFFSVSIATLILVLLQLDRNIYANHHAVFKLILLQFNKWSNCFLFSICAVISHQKELIFRVKVAQTVQMNELEWWSQMVKLSLNSLEPLVLRWIKDLMHANGA